MENKVMSPEQEEAIKSILGKSSGEDYVTVTLPTNGLSYGSEVEIRPFNFADEKFALKADVKKADFMNVLLERCIRGIDLDTLFICDKAFLIHKLKEISTGSEISLKIKCDSCDKEKALTVDLTLLNQTTMEKNSEYPLRFTLKVLGKEVVVRPGRVSDEPYMQSFELFSNNLWRFLESINEVEDKTVISEVIPRLPVEDVHEIMKMINLSDYGIDPKFNYLCAFCSNQQEVEVPLTANFFGTN